MQATEMPVPELYRTPSKGGMHAAKALFNDALEALLADGAAHERLAGARECLEKVDRVRDLDPYVLRELRCIVDDFSRRLEKRMIDTGMDSLSPEDEFVLSERLLSLYIGLSDGALIG